MVRRRVEVEEQYLFWPEQFELVASYLTDIQAWNPGHVAEPEPLFVDQPPQFARATSRICRTQRLVSASRLRNRDVGRGSDRNKIRKQPLADEGHVARHNHSPVGRGRMNGGIQ